VAPKRASFYLLIAGGNSEHSVGRDMSGAGFSKLDPLVLSIQHDGGHRKIVSWISQEKNVNI
jgi:hypothetical protein